MLELGLGGKEFCVSERRGRRHSRQRGQEGRGVTMVGKTAWERAECGQMVGCVAASEEHGADNGLGRDGPKPGIGARDLVLYRLGRGGYGGNRQSDDLE